MKSFRVLLVILEAALGVASSSAQVTTSQYDNLRTGATLNEKLLTPQNVAAKSKCMDC